MRIAQSSLVPGQSLCRFVVDTFGFPFCQRLWDLTKRRDGIVVADMVEDMVADKKLASVELDMVADIAMQWGGQGGRHGGRQ